MTKPAEIVAFWEEAGPARWFAKEPAFDALFRDHFLAAYEVAAGGGHDDWAATAEGALALLILLDQFPRNVFRGSPQSFATDAKALEIAEQAVANGLDQQYPLPIRIFFYLPFEHSEELTDQQASVRLFEGSGQLFVDYAALHLDVIQRFSRFPHRNEILGRVSTPEELSYMAEGGFSG